MSTTTTPSQTAEIRRLLSTLSLSPSSVLELPQPTCASHSPSAVRAVRAAFKRKSLLVHPDRNTDPHAAAAYAVLRAAYDAARFENGDTAEDANVGSINADGSGAAAAAEPENRTPKPPASPPLPAAAAATSATAAPVTPSQAAEIHRLISRPSLPSFTVLELPQTTCASQSPHAVRAVRAAFHSKSRLIHPDRCAHPNAGAAFSVLRNAYNAVCAGDDFYNMPAGGGGSSGNAGAPRTAAAAAGAAARKSSAEESFSAFYDRCTREADRQMAEEAAEAADAESRRTGSPRRKKAPKPKTTARPVLPPRAESFEEMYDRCTRAAEDYMSKEQKQARREEREARRRRKQERDNRGKAEGVSAQ
ncbi:hypothetical protein BDZ88DRAFT_507935 [Geranomyces variabilis]|nr:hypothetical protein BDZ88DRAFT_507935 [Geranomyces variabilis]KAJ3143295.1 hypothetical protein HDU90_000053 [Geranomyces variabilis]